MLVFSRLDALMAAARPRAACVLALDGPAPLAKLLTQRRRRRRAGRKEGEGRPDRKGARAAPPPGEPPLSSLALTPGSPFMAFVEAALEYYVCARLGAGRWPGLQLELSGAGVPGEGEVKLLARLAAGHWAGPAASAGTHCLVGGDSDLLLMAAACRADGPVFVMVDDPRPARRSGSGRGGGDRYPPPTPPRLFSVAALDAALGRALGGAPPARLAAARRDLALLAVAACGNDYLPPLTGLTLPAAWRAYLRAAAAENPPPPLVAVADDGAVTIDAYALAGLLEAVTGGDPAAGGAPPAAAAAGSDDDDDDFRPPADPPSYAGGLAWLLAAYVTGRCVDYRFVYDGRGPHAADLARALRQGPPSIAPPHPARPPLPPAVCAAALLPPGEPGRDAAPRALRGLWSEGSPVADLYAGCAVCDSLSTRAAGAQRAMLVALETARAAAKEAGAPAVAAPRTPKVEAARAAVRAAAMARRAHVRTVHPYEPFPLARLEAAVAAALAEEAGPDAPLDAALLSPFGHASRYWRPGGRLPPGPPCPLPAPPAARLPPLDPSRPPVARERLLEVGVGGAPAAAPAAPGGRPKPPLPRAKKVRPPAARRARPAAPAAPAAMRAGARGRPPGL